MPKPRTLDDLLGHVRLTYVGAFVYGEQPPPMLSERFDRHGECVERRVLPPVIKIVYD